MSKNYHDTKADWKLLWAQIASCNSKQLIATTKYTVNSHIVSTSSMVPSPLLQAGTVLSIPSLPEHYLRGSKPSKQALPATKRLCGCTPRFKVQEPHTTWLRAIQAQYPGLEPDGFAAGLLALCNSNAAYVPSPNGRRYLLAPGQMLQGICISIHGLSFKQFLNNAHTAVAAVQASMATKAALAGVKNGSAASRAQQHAAIAAVPRARLESNAACVISWSAGDVAMRQVELSNACPVYDNGCSGPSDALAYQDKLLPCCEAHDW